MSLIETLKEAEGFRGMPYDDSLGKPTICYGTLLPLTEEEGEWLLRHRLDERIAELRTMLRDEEVGTSATLPEPVWLSLCEMSYQLGVPKLRGFRKMLAAIERKDWEKAADEALDSRWARQTPNRARRIADQIRSAPDVETLRKNR